ncbi:hypothetical protein [Auraticoccus monumenti]|uniref:MinD-like ATPase involved in chromosome partitioning or flagellar assembly n=1 Tax=Auraticoccus monumenti TaxID=675864 RepID=A0A1G6UH95_9ACTN|nr:hypothetical protein [Auraticoccus monumenti]SDD39905.1 hypothetical protein SAMN04489747_0868 [Auraticoccus monumenti]
MALLVLAAAAGSPGVTATSVGLSLLWPRDVLLVDGDRDPSQSVLAGFLQGADGRGRGLVELARAHREGRPLEREVLHHTLVLAGDGTRQRLFLPGFTRPGTALLFSRVWGDLARALQTLDTAGFDVVVDAGRIGAAGLPRELVGAADAVAVLTRSTLRSLAATRLYLPELQETVALSQGQLGLVLVGEGRPYSAREIAGQFGLPVWLVVAEDAAAAAVFSDGAPHPRKLGQSAYVRSLRQGAETLFGLATRSRRLVSGVPR